MMAEQFQTPYTPQEKKKLSMTAKKVSPLEIIQQETPFLAEEVIKNYFRIIQNETKKVFETAQNAKSTGFDLSDTVEVTPAVDLADRAETIIGLVGLAKRFRELMEAHKDRRKSYFQLFKEILEEK